MVEDPHESDSAPSDDENDADYLDHPETEDASDSLRPSKRHRRSPGDVSSASREGFLRLRTKGTEVIYSLEFSQTHFSSIFAGKQMESPRSYPRIAYPRTKTSYSPEEDAFIIDLKA
ncbi:hypothetical protein PMAA_090860 [Talaromyces marneffei ATCC 18224]|uniref:Uncharacterized protein n=1 Tax=Talaromyces marneffei (strain ATCC 18224 / CBS 334.59 / QM 7333) TaxID=441960 RepID=B6QJE2_TALMQ|nr:hypothetical protein PMAA_090860 [Talaromyces marneffei ATCC 18224]